MLGRRRDDASLYATTACWARRAWVAQNRDKMLPFVRAIVAGAEWVLKPENREAALKLLQDYQKISRTQAEFKLAQVTPKAAIVPEDLNRVVELRIAMGSYGPPYEPIERFYDASIWSEVTGLPRPAPFGKPQPT
jgi:ABC-type nitrate/sulfonate/bicarbonate transport system substrate-binding protein